MSGRIKEQIDLVVGEAQGVGGAIAKRFVEEGGKGCDWRRGDWLRPDWICSECRSGECRRCECRRCECIRS